MAEEEEWVSSVDVSVYDGDTEVALRQVGLGIQPMILIEPLPAPEDDPDYENSPFLRLSLSLMDIEEAEQLLGFLVTTLKTGKVTDV